MVQQVQGQRGFAAWHLIDRRKDQRNTPDRSSAYAALISNINESDRAKDVEQLDDTLRNVINETNKREGRFWKIRDEEKILAVKKVDAQEFAELSVPWHHVAIRRIAHRAGERHHRNSMSKVKKIDTSAPMEIGMAAGSDGDEVFEEGFGKASEPGYPVGA